MREALSSSSDEASDYKDETWRQEDNLWVKRTDRKYISFKWSSGCGTGKESYTGQVRDHLSNRESRRRVDYLVIQVDGEENAYKLGKDIRRFSLYSDKKCVRCVAAWAKDGWLFHKEDSKEVSKASTPIAALMETRNLSLACDGIEISNSFCGGLASKRPDFYFYRSASEICGNFKGREGLSPRQPRE